MEATDLREAEDDVTCGVLVRIGRLRWAAAEQVWRLGIEDKGRSVLLEQQRNVGLSSEFDAEISLA